MVLLVLKLLVFSHPLKLQRCPSIYVLLSLMGQAEYHFIMFLLCSRQSLCFPCTLYIIFCLITLHVIAWSLSFIAVISTMSMLSYYDPSSICFYILFDQDCVIACHLKNYLFVITYLLGTSRSYAWGC